MSCTAISAIDLLCPEGHGFGEHPCPGVKTPGFITEPLRGSRGFYTGINSSKWLNEKGIVACHFHWQTGYGAFSVSESMVKVVSRYIENQETHHQKMTFEAEFISILDKNHIEYDEQYLWD